MITIAYGGSGSTHIINTARSIFGNKNVHRRPDVNMKPEFWPEGKDIELPNYNGYDMETPCEELEFFRKRSKGYELQSGISVNANLLRYVSAMKGKEVFSVMTWASWWQFFSRNRIRDVVFLIRHPLHHCLSWLNPTKRRGHGQAFAEGGEGLFTVAGIDKFIRIWNANVDEYLRLKHLNLYPVVVRYEYMDEDHLMILGKKYRECFVDFRTDRRHFDVLPSELEQRLKQRCMWDIFYKTWLI